MLIFCSVSSVTTQSSNGKVLGLALGISGGAVLTVSAAAAAVYYFKMKKAVPTPNSVSPGAES